MAEKELRDNPKNIVCHIDDLFLDPNNYRLADQMNGRRVSEEKITDPKIQIRTELLICGKNNEDIRDLINSFKESGFLTFHQIHVGELPQGKYLVLEGNRRVAALKYLHKEHREEGLDIGKLDGFSFESIPVVLHPGYQSREYLLSMGLSHITGPKRWNPISQAQYFEDLVGKHNLSEKAVSETLGLSYSLAQYGRLALSLIKRYKACEYGDQFNLSMFPIFNEIVRQKEIMAWLEWSDELSYPQNPTNEKRLFSWLSMEEPLNHGDGGEDSTEKKSLSPIIEESEEIKRLANIIGDDKNLKRLEEFRDLDMASTEDSGSMEADRFVRKYLEASMKDIDSMLKIKNKSSAALAPLGEVLRDYFKSKGILIRGGTGDFKHVMGKNARHYSEVFIHQFRGLEEVTLKNVNRINILAGPNNSGKTSILEALFLLNHLNDIDAFFEMEMYRGKFIKELNANWLVKNFLNDVRIEGRFDNEKVSLDLKALNSDEDFDKSGYLKTFNLNALFGDRWFDSKAHIFEDKESETFYQKKYILCPSIMTSPYRVNDRELRMAHDRAVENKDLDRTIEFIREHIDNSIEGIDMTSYGGMYRFLVNSSRFEKSIDITNYGEGLQRVFEIGLFFSYARNGVVLIDEFESAIHKSLLVDFSRFVQELAEEFNVQVFLTSHSKECIDAFIYNNYKTEDITAYSLQEEEGRIRCKYVKGPRLEKLLDSIDVDIRGKR